MFSHALRLACEAHRIPYELKEQQRTGLRSLIEGQDTLVLLPTGFGKTLIYALIPTVADIIHGHGHDFPAGKPPLSQSPMPASPGHTDPLQHVQNMSNRRRQKRYEIGGGGEVCMRVSA